MGYQFTIKWLVYLWDVLHLHLVGGSSGSRWLSSRFPSPPSWEGDLLVIHIRVPISYWIFPVAQCRIPGGTVNSLRATSWWRSPISCLSWALPRYPRSVWNWHGVLPSFWGLLGGGQGTSSLSGVRDWVPEGCPSLTTIKAFTGGRYMKPYGLFMQSCGFGDSTCHDQHFICRMK